MIRDCSSFQCLDGEFVRFCIMLPEHNEQLLNVLKRAVKALFNSCYIALKLYLRGSSPSSPNSSGFPREGGCFSVFFAEA